MNEAQWVCVVVLAGMVILWAAPKVIDWWRYRD